MNYARSIIFGFKRRGSFHDDCCTIFFFFFYNLGQVVVIYIAKYLKV